MIGNGPRKNLRFADRLTAGCDCVSASVVVLTVLVLPWLLGGVIPLARLVLLIGAVTSTLFMVPGLLISRQSRGGIPLLAFPLIGLTILGLLQCRDSDGSIVAGMQHAIRDVTAVQIPTIQDRHTLSFAHTRQSIGLVLALGLLSMVSCRQLRTGKALAITATLFVVNGILLAAVGLPGLFHENQFWLNEYFAMNLAPKSGRTTFATFVNPNNAAGWLLLCLACAAGVTWYLLQSSPSEDGQKYGQLDVPAWEKAVRRVGTFVAELNNYQVLCLIIVGFLSAAVCATQSRGGIAALAAGILAVVLTHSNLKTLPLVLLGVVFAGLGALFLLNSFGLTDEITTELQTLNTLEKAAGSRPQLWKDSLEIVRDFPVFGTGLGTYQFAILPYQSQKVATWFRNADNHFVDLIVEGGVLGLALFLMPGVIALLLYKASAILKQKRSRSERQLPRQTSRRALGACGVTLVFIVAAIGAAACFDYGIGMPASSSFFVVVVAAITGYLNLDRQDNRLSAFKRGYVQCGRIAALAMAFSMITFAACLVPDQWAAVSLDPLVVRAHRLMDVPSPENLDQLTEVRNSLERALTLRPDDPEGLRMLTRVAEAEIRWSIRLLVDPDVREAASFIRAWKATHLVDLVGYIATAEVGQKVEWESRFRDAIKVTQFKQHLLRTQSLYPLMPTIADSLALVDHFQAKGENLSTLTTHARFVRPNNGYVLWRLGVFATRSQKLDLAREVWQASIKHSPELQAGIFMDSFRFWPSDQAIEYFSPKSFIACVTTATNTGSKPFRLSILKEAERLWQNLAEPTAEDYVLRHRYLQLTAVPDEIIPMLEVAIGQYKNHVELIRLYARELDQRDRFNSARVQWDRVNFLLQGDEEARRRMQAIDNMVNEEESEKDALEVIPHM